MPEEPQLQRRQSSTALVRRRSRSGSKKDKKPTPPTGSRVKKPVQPPVGPPQHPQLGGEVPIGGAKTATLGEPPIGGPKTAHLGDVPIGGVKSPRGGEKPVSPLCGAPPAGGPKSPPHGEVPAGGAKSPPHGENPLGVSAFPPGGSPKKPQLSEPTADARGRADPDSPRGPRLTSPVHSGSQRRRPADFLSDAELGPPTSVVLPAAIPPVVVDSLVVAPVEDRPSSDRGDSVSVPDVRRHAHCYSTRGSGSKSENRTPSPHLADAAAGLDSAEGHADADRRLPHSGEEAAAAPVRRTLSAVEPSPAVEVRRSSRTTAPEDQPATVAAYKAALSDYRNERAHLRSRLSALEDILAEAESSAETSKQEAQSAKAEAARSADEACRLADEADRLRAEVERLRSFKGNDGLLRDELREARADAAQARQEEIAATSQANKDRWRVQMAEKEAAEATAECAKLRVQLAAAEAQARTAAHELQVLRLGSERQRQETERLTQLLENSQSTKRSLDSQSEAHAEEVVELRKQLDAEKLRCQELEQREKQRQERPPEAGSEDVWQFSRDSVENAGVYQRLCSDRDTARARAAELEREKRTLEAKLEAVGRIPSARCWSPTLAVRRTPPSRVISPSGLVTPVRRGVSDERVRGGASAGDADGSTDEHTVLGCRSPPFTPVGGKTVTDVGQSSWLGEDPPGSANRGESGGRSRLLPPACRGAFPFPNPAARLW
eukprot:TRINITY_DN995_c1_g1_i1.p1 TRINITY_DN995_c1_g1~~TRINITY_DN995_c1_g1_i1.p1  ORF type:complete len:741 (+),score=54.56 TRINITY_DN995_c1_g1_i1:61-2223(+)